MVNAALLSVSLDNGGLCGEGGAGAGIRGVIGGGLATLFACFSPLPVLTRHVWKFALDHECYSNGVGFPEPGLCVLRHGL